MPDGLDDEVTEHLTGLEAAMGRKLGDAADPLLVSVRSGAKFSMPGMMETVLNIGLSDESVHGLAKQARQRAVRLGLLPPPDPDVRQDRPGHRGRARSSTPSTTPSRPRAPRTTWTWTRRTCRRLVETFKEIVRRRRPAATSRRTPASRCDMAVSAVFDSWNADRRDPVPPPGAHPGRPGHRGQHRVRWSSATWAWTPAPAWPSPATRAAASRASTATTCRTRRARTSSPASATRSRCRTWSGIDAKSLRRAHARSCDAGEPLPRPVRHRVHDRARQAVDAADPGGQAHRGRRVPDRRPARRPGPHRPGRGADPGDRRPARAADVPPVRRASSDVKKIAKGDQRLPGRGGRQGGLRLRPGPSRWPTAARTSSWSAARPTPTTCTA